MEWIVPVGHLSGDTVNTILLQRRKRQQKAVSQVVFLCVLSAAPAGAGDSSLGGVCVNEAGQAAGTAFRRSGKAVYGRYFPKQADIFHGRCHAGQHHAKIRAEASAENETENSSGIRNCFFSNRSGTTCFAVVAVPSVFAVPANAGGGAVLLAASGSGRGNASGRRFICMGTVPCEKIRACRKSVDKHVRILQKEKSTGTGI